MSLCINVLSHSYFILQKTDILKIQWSNIYTIFTYIYLYQVSTYRYMIYYIANIRYFKNITLKIEYIYMITTM